MGSDQGFSAFWYSNTPKIKTEQLCVPANQNWIPFHTPKSKSLEKSKQNVVIFSLFNLLRTQGLESLV
jgi:hypothetical protein